MVIKEYSKRLIFLQQKLHHQMQCHTSFFCGVLLFWRGYRYCILIPGNSISAPLGFQIKGFTSRHIFQSIKRSIWFNGYSRRKWTRRHDCPVSWGCRIHWLHICPGYDTKQSDGEVPAVLELWGMRSTPSLLWLPGPLWPGVVAPDRALSMG